MGAGNAFFHISKFWLTGDAVITVINVINESWCFWFFYWDTHFFSVSMRYISTLGSDFWKIKHVAEHSLSLRFGWIKFHSQKCFENLRLMQRFVWFLREIHSLWFFYHFYKKIHYFCILSKYSFFLNSFKITLFGSIIFFCK